MPLWSKTDAEASVPKFLTEDQRKDVIFVDATEAADSDTRAKGITSPGWWKYTSQKDSSGRIRHKAELLIPMKVSAVAAGDRINDTGIETVDTYVLDFTTHPSNASVTAPTGTTFAVVGAISTGGGTISYQWQEASANDKNFTTLADTGIYSGVTTNTLTLADSLGFTPTINAADGADVDFDRTINLAGAIVTKGEKYIVTIGANSFTYTALLTDTLVTITSKLALLIDAHASYVAAVDGTTNTQINVTTGAGTSVISVRTTGMNKRKYRCVITATNAVAETSKFATLTVA